MGSMSYYCWHHPWGEYVGRQNYKPLSFYVSGWNVLLMWVRWVLAIIEDYMMVEYVDFPKKDLGTYIQLDMGGMNYYCWHHPWGEYVGRLNYKPLSFYVSGWNFFLMCMRWVLAIIEDYMMVEYVDLPKGSDTWPFLKIWWIVVAKLTENIVFWFLIEFLLYTSMLWWIVTCSWEVIWSSLLLLS